jgi:amidophosphoribosyltransferase
LLQALKKLGKSMQDTVLSYIPNTSELAYNGLVKEAEDHLKREAAAFCPSLLEGLTPDEMNARLMEVLSVKVRSEKVIHKDAKIRTFIQEDSSREHLTLHAYDVHYGTIRRGSDAVVALDDSIVRGNTLKRHPANA